MEARARFEEYLNKNPLLKFSVYTDTYYTTLRALGREIIRDLDAAVTPDPNDNKKLHVNGQAFEPVYGNVWLWVLGAYEVTRTMCQAKQCFSPNVISELRELKTNLTLLRIPFAKQELPGNKKNRVPVSAEPSIYTMTGAPVDLRFRVVDRVLSIRELIGHFETVLGGITPADVLNDHRTTYSAPTGG